MVILHADMIGYSRLIGRDDSGTFLRLRSLRGEVIEPALLTHDGILRNTAGDSLLVTFTSIDRAVDAALAIQHGIAAYEGNREDKIEFRIGINLGDAIIDDGDICGDGINVAVRLQAACPPGRICVSRAIRDHSRQRRDIQFDPLGRLTLKNIDKPVEAFVLAEDRHFGPTRRVFRRANAAIPAWRFRKAYAALAAIIPIVSLLGLGIRYYIDSETSRSQQTQVAALTASQKVLAEAVARDKGVPLAIVARVLTRLEESDSAPQSERDADLGDIQRRLESKADEFVALRLKLKQVMDDEPAVSERRAQAESALNRGDLLQAQAMLRQAAALEMTATRALSERARVRADAAVGLLEKSAELAAVTLHYSDAADDFGQATALVAPFDRKEQWRLEVRRAEMLRRQGEEFGDHGALLGAIERYDFALTLVSGDADRLAWAETETDLGSALVTLGQLQWGSERLEQAVVAFRAALAVRSRETLPREWADTQRRLANVLWRLGEREVGTRRLNQAKEILDLILQERARADDPLSWARTQDTLGSVLRWMGGRENSTARLEQALAAHRAAATEFQRDKRAEDWGRVQSDIGLDLFVLGVREPGVGRLHDAIAAYEEVLSVRSRSSGPLRWARITSNLGVALWRLAEREDGTARFEEAIAKFHAALEERTVARAPRDRSQTQTMLGRTLLALSQREAGTTEVSAAVTALRQALQAKDRSLEPLAWASAQDDLGDALRELGDREDDAAALRDALVAYGNALAERARERFPELWAITEAKRGWTLMLLGERETGTARYEEALAVERAVLEARPHERLPLAWATTETRIGVILTLMGKRESSPERLHEAIAAYRDALTERPRETRLIEWRNTATNLSVALRLSGDLEHSMSLLQEATAMQRDVQATQRRAQSPYQWARATCNLAIDLAQLGHHEPGTVHLEEAEADFADCLPLLEAGDTEPLKREAEQKREFVQAEIAQRRPSTP